MRPILILASVAALLTGCEAEPQANTATSRSAERPAANSARTINASFDCDRAKGQAQELVCGDPGLAAMDREVARLATLAAEPAAAADWAQQRDDCTKADELRQCVMAAAVLRIHRLRQGSDAARTGEGLSIGPVAFTCQGMSNSVEATFVNSSPGALALEWGGRAIAIDQVEAASGARYEGRWNGQPYSFWNKGREATFTVPGKGDLHCAEQRAD